MKNIKYLLFIFLMNFSLASCDSDTSLDNPEDSVIIHCDKLTTNLIDQNHDSLLIQLYPVLEDLTLIDQDNDNCLHDNNLQAFSELLTDNCSQLNASVLCCGCIDTNPAISEINIQVDSFGTVVTRILDLYTPDDNETSLSFAGVHR